jgi:cell division septal protein FtsQ
VILFIVIGTSFVFGGFHAYRVMMEMLTIDEIIILGNKHLTKTEVRNLLHVKRHESIFSVSGTEMRERLLLSPWIRETIIRKELPHTVVIKIREAEPLALLKRKKSLYIVSREGAILEKLEQTIPFLPVIEVKSNRKGTLKQALELASTLRTENFFYDKEIEIIANSSKDISLIIDGLIIKVGAGDYRKKLLRLAQLKDEIIRRGIPVEYIDLRFSKRLIVKAPQEAVNE